MHIVDQLNRKLDARFGDKVRAQQEGDVVTLTGHVDTWMEKVEAGRMCASKQRSYYIVNDIVSEKEDILPMRVPPIKDTLLEGKHYDAVIIGAGIVGSAIARELARYNISILLLEKEHDVAMQASSRNDGMVHPGIDLKKGTQKQKYNKLGNEMYDKVCEELGVPFQRVGQYLGFVQKGAKYVLPLTPVHWHKMGVPCKYVSRKELLEKEPHLNKEVVCGLSFPSAGIVCPYNLTIAYAENAVDNGVKLSLDTAVLNMNVQNGVITSVVTNRGTIYPGVVINAAGVFSDEVAQMANDRFFSIHPRKGTNAILDKKAAYQVQTIASFLGTASTKTTHSKGGGVVSTIDGNLLIGPDAVETNDKEDYATTKESVASTFAKQGIASPLLKIPDIITYFTGVRAPTYEEDFVITKGRKTKNLVHAAGIQSPGLTAAPAIGVSVAKMAVELLGESKEVTLNKNFNPIRKAIPRTAELSIEERNQLIKQNPDYGVIVCRCEEVSRGEIIDALHRSVPCDTVDGVKRRVRPGMGRCQGGFCGPLVTGIIAKEKGISIDEVLKSGYGSELVYNPTKEALQNE
ncbi:NAD(P)/FAD-dependent oxidoreductase [Paludicola sp. MB14-C6]|uniref:NAD(P)/FAD-dependent oxidoreductase n=1 Tax=Paludihabitans sp. MB14-C6 TaxID=3070656 RepID=UPI0027DDE254|nr:NAD(P)/FAD-dependent oxidoreductase [Paludicola sp. MB14-C6]WMJ22857.1 NAD(P)/FAD-dependent oxidoreductase [Paludicola sp. MB14-C6]